MGIASTGRNFAFWTLDALKGSPIKKDLKAINNFYSAPKKVQQQEQKSKLNSLLHTAVTTTEFYKDYNNFKTLEDFPVVNKNIIKSNFETINRKTKNKEKLISVNTSGSMGAPFKVYQTPRKKIEILIQYFVSVFVLLYKYY